MENIKWTKVQNSNSNRNTKLLYYMHITLDSSDAISTVQKDLVTSTKYRAKSTSSRLTCTSTSNVLVTSTSTVAVGANVLIACRT